MNQPNPPPEAAGGLENLLDQLPFLEPLARLPPLAQAGVILAAALVLAKVSGLILGRLVPALTRHTKTHLDDDLAAALRRPVFTTVTLLGLMLASRRLALPPGLDRATAGVLATLLVMIWLVAGFRIAALLLDALSRNQQRFPVVQERTIPLFNTLAKVFLVGAAVYAVLVVWNIDATAWLTSAGIVGIAVGFAAKDTLANLFAGVFIVADSPYKLGDFIILDSGERGRVTHVGLRSTRLLTRDDIEITIPNAVIANSKITNESGGPWEKERIRIAVGVAYGSDVDQVCEVLTEVAKANEHVCSAPEPRVRFRAFGESSLDLELLCWIDEPVLRGKMVHDLNMGVYKAFHRNGIEIPFPQRDVHLRSLPVGVAAKTEKPVEQSPGSGGDAE